MLCYLYLLLLLSGPFTATGHERSATKSDHTGELRSDKQENYVDVSYHLCYTECVSKIMERSCIVIPENFKQEVLKDGFLQKKQKRNNQLGIFSTRAFDKSTKSHAHL